MATKKGGKSTPEKKVATLNDIQEQVKELQEWRKTVDQLLGTFQTKPRAPLSDWRENDIG